MLSKTVHYRTVVRLRTDTKVITGPFCEENLSLDFSVFSISGCSRADFYFMLVLNLLNESLVNHFLFVILHQI